jgi:hypothetical protein
MAPYIIYKYSINVCIINERGLRLLASPTDRCGPLEGCTVARGPRVHATESEKLVRRLVLLGYIVLLQRTTEAQI